MSKQNNKAPFRIFVASSLRPEFLDIRKKIQGMVEQLNAENVVPFEFSLYRFEVDDMQNLRIDGSQKNINKIIDESHAFIMMCDNNVGEKTVEEFEHAMCRFKELGLPAFIAIYKFAANKECGTNQITYEKFDNSCLNLLRQDIKGRLVYDKYIYPLEKQEDEDGLNQLLEKFKDDLKKWITEYPKRPLFGAMLGIDIHPEDLYSDIRRREKCKDQIYFHRTIDDVLYDAMEEVSNNTILIQGDSLSGKTRALYQAIKSFESAWYYKFCSDSAKIVGEIESVVTYLENSALDTPMYLIVDDIHLLSNSDELIKAFESLKGRLNDKVKLIATSTTRDSSLIDFDKVINIRPMSDDEYYEARLFFKRHYGNVIQSGYRNIGAMMIDLTVLKKKYNSTISTISTIGTNNEDKRTMISSIMISIKAFSIWHNSSIGDVKKLVEFACFMCGKKTEQEDLYATLESVVKNNNLPGIICRKTCRRFFGRISKQVPETLQIEEYIYRYVLDYNGEVQQDKEIPYTDELRTIKNILDFVCETKAESIIVTLSKIARRVEFKENRTNIVNFVYDLFKNNDITNYSSKTLKELFDNTSDWYGALVDELNQINSGEIDSQQVAENSRYLSKILHQKIFAEETFNGAIEIFKNLPASLQSVEMLVDLIKKSKENVITLLPEVEKLDLYKANQTKFMIIANRLPLCADFKEAIGLVEQGDFAFAEKSSKSSRSDDGYQELLTQEVERKLFIVAIQRLAEKVGSFEQLEQLLRIMKDRYVLFLNDVKLVERFLLTETDLYNAKNLTIVDCFARLSTWSLKMIFESIVATHRFSEVVTYVNHTLYPELDRTLEVHTSILKAKAKGENRVVDDSILYTPRYMAKNVVSTILNCIIGAYRNYDYREVFDKLFLPMVHKTSVEGDINKGEVLFLRNAFTYAFMLEMNGCKFIDAKNLFEHYMRPHAENNNEHFRVSHLLLNRILKKVSTKDEYRYVNGLFKDLEIARDVYSYNEMLKSKHTAYDECVEKIIPEMISKGLHLDRYTLGNLIAKATNIQIAARYFAQSEELKIGGIFNKVPAEYEATIKDLIDDYTKTENYPLPLQHFFWAELFSKQCANDKDREILSTFLGYLENAKDKGNLFDNGIIYNNCINNRTFVCSYDEAQKFIKDHNVTVDAYTIKHLQSLIIRESEDVEQRVERLNGLYVENKSVVAQQVKNGKLDFYYHRLRAFKSQNDTLKLVFINAQEEANEEECTPLSYIKCLKDHNIPIKEYVIKVVLDVKNDLTNKHIEDLVRHIKEYNIPVSDRTISQLGEACKRIEDFDDRDLLNEIFQLPVTIKEYSAGKKIVNFYEWKLFDLSTAFESVNTKIDNAVEKLYSYTQLLSCYRKGLGKEVKNEDFKIGWGLYEKYVTGNEIKPNPDILSVLANLSYDSGNLDKIVNECEKYNVVPNHYMLSAIMRCSQSYIDAQGRVKWYIERGGQFPEGAVDTVLRGINIFAKRNDEEACDYINALACYLIRVGRKEDVCAYPKDLSAFPCFEDYGRGAQVTRSTLRSIFDVWANFDNEGLIDKAQELLKLYYPSDKSDFDKEFIGILRKIAQRYGVEEAKMDEMLSSHPNLRLAYVM